MGKRWDLRERTFAQQFRCQSDHLGSFCRLVWTFLNSHSRSRAGVDVCQIFCDGINDKYSDYLVIFTDGSKDPESGQAGSAFSVPKMGVKMQKRL